MGIVGKLLNKDFKYYSIKIKGTEKYYPLYEVDGLPELPRLMKKMSKGTLQTARIELTFMVKTPWGQEASVATIFFFNSTSELILVNLFKATNDDSDPDSLSVSTVPGHPLTSTHVLLMKEMAALMEVACHNTSYFMTHGGGLSIPDDWTKTYDEGQWNCKMRPDNVMEVQFLVGEVTFPIGEVTGSMYKKELNAQIENIIESCVLCEVKQVFFVFPELNNWSVTDLYPGNDYTVLIEEVLKKIEHYNPSLKEKPAEFTPAEKGQPYCP